MLDIVVDSDIDKESKVSNDDPNNQDDGQDDGQDDEYYVDNDEDDALTYKLESHRHDIQQERIIEQVSPIHLHSVLLRATDPPKDTDYHHQNLG